MTALEERIAAILLRWVEAVCRNARTVALGVALVSLVAAVYAVRGLGIDTDPRNMLGEGVPFRQTWEEFDRHFPTLDDALLVVVEGETPELTREAADALARQLARRSSIRDVFVPGAGEFFERNGLLYQSVEELEALADHVAEVQPILAELARDPSLANLAQLVELGLERARNEEEGRDWPAILERVGRATVEAYDEHPVQVSWEDVLLAGSNLDPARRRVVVVEPVLDFDSLLPAARPLQEVRDTAAALELNPEQGVRVRITGNPALNHEEMLSLVWDVFYAGLASIAFICGVLYFALRSVRLVGASVTTLVAGLVWTAAVAAFAIGRLNTISIAFAVLFVGLGIAFAIHLGMHYEESRRMGAPHPEALQRAVRGVGASLVICAATTAIGFYAFIPTDFRGVGELGFISGTGMFVILFLTLTLFPALLELWLRDKADWPPTAGPVELSRLGFVESRPRATAAVAAGCGCVALALLPSIEFDANVIELRDPTTESVQAFRDLLAESTTSPWQIEILASDLPEARELATRLRALPVVERAITVADFVPPDQDEKIDILFDLALMLDVPAGRAEPRDPPTVAEQVAALRDLHDFLDRPELRRGGGPFVASARRLRAELGTFLERVERDPDPQVALANLEKVLLGRLPNQLERIQKAVSPAAFGMDDLPPRVVRRMVAPDGRARVQVSPRENVNDAAALAAFVDGVEAVWPDTTGMAANIIGFSRATARSLREALVLSFLAVAAVLWLLWRRPAEIGLALGPLALGAVLTGATAVAFGIPFNFVNVIVIPLLLGMGVDSGIHLVHRGVHLASERAQPEAGLASTVTARAVFYSAITTTMSFGSLAFSAHRGLASLGTLLVIGMVLTLACNLLVLPALIRIYRSSKASTRSR